MIGALRRVIGDQSVKDVVSWYLGKRSACTNTNDELEAKLLRNIRRIEMVFRSTVLDELETGLLKDK